MIDFTNDIFIALPEIFLIFVALILTLLGCVYKNNASRVITNLSIIALFITLIMLDSLHNINDLIAFNGFYFVHDVTKFPKMLLIIASIIIMFLYSGEKYKQNSSLGCFEFPILVLLCVAGISILLSANDFLILYLGLEMQALSIYVLISLNSNSKKSYEAALKYFVLGAIASGFILYGISLVYGFTGTTNYQALQELFTNADYSQSYMIAIIVGLVFILIGACFKLSAVPFHMWTPDVYEGSSTIVMAILANLSKIGAIGFLITLLLYPFGEWIDIWQQVIYFAAIMSMIIGSLGGLKQDNIKRLMAYSTINHIGFILLGIACGSNMGVSSIMQYLMIYVIMSLGLFAIILNMKRNGIYCEKISDLKGSSSTNKFLSFSIATIMFSMAGIPPLAGFYIKYYILRDVILSNLYLGAIIAIITSTIAAFYYLRIIKIMYFEQPEDNVFDISSKRNKFIIIVSVAVNLLYFLI
jgi:NADH-quinone oxidoreductase subunit N